MSPKCSEVRFLYLLICISDGIFFLTMTPGYTRWYYESVELIFVNVGAKLGVSSRAEIINMMLKIKAENKISI